VWATPTASYRSLVAWRRGRTPVVVKVSIGATIGRIWRAFRENLIARAVLMSSVFETIPKSHLEELGFDWFVDCAGMVETASRHGWLLRKMPRRVAAEDGRYLVPLFSLVSTRGDRAPLLVEQIRRSGRDPETFVLETLVKPYVETVAYLLFVQGIQAEAHQQNVLFETDEEESLTGRMVLRDLSDQTLSIPMRVARGKPLPTFAPGTLPEGAPFPLASVATDVAYNANRPRLFRGYDTVERFGLWSFLWVVNSSLTRFFPAYDTARIVRSYLERWQEAAIRYLGVKPLFREVEREGDPPGIATDEALACFLQRVDWKRLGAGEGHALPRDVESSRLVQGARKRSGPVYARLECAWGDIFLLDGLPRYFRPAF
jgi:hypothetical protein